MLPPLVYRDRPTILPALRGYNLGNWPGREVPQSMASRSHSERRCATDRLGGSSELTSETSSRSFGKIKRDRSGRRKRKRTARFADGGIRRWVSEPRIGRKVGHLPS